MYYFLNRNDTGDDATDNQSMATIKVTTVTIHHPSDEDWTTRQREVPVDCPTSTMNEVTCR